MARLLTQPELIQTVPVDLLETLAAPLVTVEWKPAAPKAGAPSSTKPTSEVFDVAAYLKKMGKDQDVEGPEPWEGGQRWTFKTCPWRESDGSSASIVQFANGALSAGCFHDTCPGSRSDKQNRWKDLRALWEGSEPESHLDVIKRLAELHPLDYEKVRVEEAKKLNCRTTELDKLVWGARPSGGARSSSALEFTVDVWPDPVIPCELLDEIQATIRKFIICSEETALAATLWAAFTWVIDSVQVAPLAVITAPEPRCGKTQFLDLLGRLACRPLVASNISPAAVFRVIEAHKPTLMIDEADSFLKENEELRGVINSGHTRQSAYVIRTVGDDHEPQRFSTWGAKALSGIGHLQGTLMDRAVVLELRRKLKTEKVQRLRHADPNLFIVLASKLARFGEDAGQAIQMARPALPEELNDRAQDNWEPLLAIADHAGNGWPQRARKAAITLAGVDKESLSLSTQLLEDMREIFETEGRENMASADLLKRLAADDLKPWATFDHGRPMTPRQLARLLKGYGVKTKDIKMGMGSVKKGFTWEQLSEVFLRYLDPPSEGE
jgi:putative DNA primase/helicase